MFWNGMTYVASLLGLALAVSWSYSVAQEAFASGTQIFRQTVRRSAKLLGVLAGLGLIVYLLSKIS